MLRKILLLISFAISGLATAQSWDFTIGATESSGSSTSDIAVDRYQNIYTTGSYYDQIKFGDSVFENDTYYNRLYIAKFNEKGDFIRNTNFYTSRDGLGMKVNLGKKTNTLYTLANASYGYMSVGKNTVFDKVLIKTSLSGQPIWTASFDATDFTPDFCLDKDDNAYIAFSSIETGKFGDLNFENYDGLYNDIGVGKFDENGKAIWAKLFNVPSGVGRSNSIAEHGSNIYVAGSFEENMYYGNQLINGDPNGVNGFLGILSKEDGSLVDYLIIGSEGFQSIYDVEVFGNGDFVISGVFTDSVILGNQTLVEKGKDGDFFVAKFNAKKEVLWAHHLYSTGLNAQNTYINDIGIDKSGNVYLAGAACEITYIFNKTYTSKGVTDAFLSKISANGAVEYTLMAGSTGSDEVSAINVTEDGIVHLFGEYEDDATFGNITLSGIGYRNYFISRIIGNGNVLTGKIYYDLNKDGIFNNQDVPLKSTGIKNTKEEIAFTDSLGNYTFWLDKGTYNIEIPGLLKGYTLVPEAATSFSGYGENKTQNYRIIPETTERFDLQIEMAPLSRFRPGFASSLVILASNIGNKSSDASIGIQLPSTFTYDSASVEPGYIASDSLNWKINSFPPLAEQKVVIYGKIKVGIFPDGFAQFTASITSQANIDAYNQNNVDTLLQAITGSYDPNDKLVSKSEVTNTFFEDKQFLEYTIRFQNTGTDTAFTVIVSDTISPLLDYKSIKVLANSHPYNVHYGKNNDVHFTFEDILLPDSTTNQEASNGFITFRIYPSGKVKDGDIIRNKAYIFFDYNPAIITNTAEVKVKAPGLLSSKPKTVFGVNVFPNPVRESYFYITKPKGRVTSITLTYTSSNSEHLQYTDQGENLKVSLPMSISKGLYIGTIQSEYEQSTFKLLVE